MFPRNGNIVCVGRANQKVLFVTGSHSASRYNFFVPKKSLDDLLLVC